MSEDTFGTPAEDFDPFYVQAESALMELDAMARGVLSRDAGGFEETIERLVFAFTGAPKPTIADLAYEDPDAYVAYAKHAMSGEKSH